MKLRIYKNIKRPIVIFVSDSGNGRRKMVGSAGEDVLKKSIATEKSGGWMGKKDKS